MKNVLKRDIDLEDVILVEGVHGGKNVAQYPILQPEFSLRYGLHVER